MKLQRAVQKNGNVSLPLTVRQSLDISPGDKVVFIMAGKKVYIKKENEND